MATLKAELKDILQKYDIDPRDKSKLWDCHGTLVLYHRAYEVIAAREGITFDAPAIIEAKSADKIVALLVTGRMGDRAEWSIGEAAPGNCKNAYVYAIAEKRAKDRVIAKLVGLAEHVYSEDEADEFKDAPREAATAQRAAPPSQPPVNGNGHQAPAQQPLARIPNPEEPAHITEGRELLIREFWTRNDYGLDPDIFDGGLAAWDGWYARFIQAAPNLDAHTKFVTDNQRFYQVWAKNTRTDVAIALRKVISMAERRLRQSEAA